MVDDYFLVIKLPGCFRILFSFQVSQLLIYLEVNILRSLERVSPLLEIISRHAFYDFMSPLYAWFLMSKTDLTI